MAETLYTRDIIKLATSIPFEERLEIADGQAEKRAPICGSHMACDVCIDDKQHITKIGIEISACALGQASAALMGQNIIGRSLPELKETLRELKAYLAGETEEITSWPSLMALSAARPHSGRHGAICLPFETVIAALDAAIVAKTEALPA
ncbi:MAG: iron-sulfur cluster assembly scaffold protein [Zymomonas mobilis]|uniref:NifU-like protein involved in Fe-S cluster formation n=1 Tax=Zymomonas mobilis TaxID=542 RepID=A0A542W0F2_ZYMMB|nr:iron-sulfur cluster assembly scaffold protein [Zymomonas mobilis]TQL17062.1 NifU-like protein involved in Fe-S cluster formation [Zymomonas mobilis]